MKKIKYYIFKTIQKLRNNKIINNSLIILSTQSIAGIISFINSFFSLKFIGVSGTGYVALAISYATLFNGLFNFQSYNALIKFGAEAKEKKDSEKYKFYIKMAMIQDIITAFIAVFFGYISLDFLSSFMNWNPLMKKYAQIYLITIPLNITGSLNAILRLNDEFSITGIINIYSNIFKFILIILCGFLNSDLIFYIYIEMIYVAFLNLLRFYFAYKSLKKQNLLNFVKTRLIFDKEFTKYNIFNNLVTSVDVPIGQAISLIINMILGVEVVGVYNFLLKIGTIVSQITESISQAIFPEFSIMVAQNNIKKAIGIMKKMFYSMNFLGILSFLLIIVTFPIWLSWLIGDSSIIYGISFALYFFYLFFAAAIMPMHLLFISLNYVQYNFIIVVICNCIYLVLLFFLGTRFNLIGIIIAMIIQSSLVFISKYIIMKKNFEVSL